MKTTIKIICSYCNKPMGIKDGKGVTGISHSICDKCLKIQLKEIENFKVKE